jgi:hypothetical protein
VTPRVAAIRAAEAAAALDRPEGYEGFEAKVRAVRDGLLDYLTRAKAARRRVAAYGAAAKGNTLLNYCGIGPGLIDYVVDRNPAKQGRLLPGSRIPVRPVEALEADRPDEVLILPWNIREEIVSQLAGLRAKGVRFLVAIPEVATVD